MLPYFSKIKQKHNGTIKTIQHLFGHELLSDSSPFFGHNGKTEASFFLATVSEDESSITKACAGINVPLQGAPGLLF